MSERTELAEAICICTGNHDPNRRVECSYAERAAEKVLAAGWQPTCTDAPRLQTDVRNLLQDKETLSETVTRQRIRAERAEAALTDARMEVKREVEGWFSDISLDDLFAVKGWNEHKRGSVR